MDLCVLTDPHRPDLYRLRSPLAMALVAFVGVLSGCFSPTYTDCEVRCNQSRSCPDSLSCQGGFCRSSRATGACSEDALDAGTDGSDAYLADGDVLDAEIERAIDTSRVDALTTADADGPADAGSDPSTDASPGDGPRVDVDVDVDVDASADGASDSPVDASPDDGTSADADGPVDIVPDSASEALPSIIFTSFDRASLSLPDLVSAADDGVEPGDGSDLVFDAVVTGPFDSLFLLASSDLSTSPATGAPMVWDTIIGNLPFPAAVTPAYARGRDTPILGISEDGRSLINQADGQLSMLSPGLHILKLFANQVRSAFIPGMQFQAAGLVGNTVVWGPIMEADWGVPSIRSLTAAPDYLNADLVGNRDTTILPDQKPDFAFDVDLTGPLDALILTAVLAAPDAYSGTEYAWDTISGDQALPSGVLPAVYDTGATTWILGVLGPSGSFINRADGSLPILIGHFSGRIYATQPFNPDPRKYTFQLLGLIGDTRVWSQTVAASDAQ